MKAIATNRVRLRKSEQAWVGYYLGFGMDCQKWTPEQKRSIRTYRQQLRAMVAQTPAGRVSNVPG